MMSRKISISKLKSHWLGILTFLACFENSFLSERYDFFDKITVIMQMVLLCLYFLLFTQKSLKNGIKSINQVSLYGTISCFLIILSTLANRGDLISAIVTASRSLIVILLLEIISKKKSNFFNVLDSWIFCMMTVVIIDLITEIVYPNGLYNTDIASINWFLGYKTARATYSLPLGYISLYTNHKRYGRATFRWYFTMVLIAYNALLSQGLGLFITVVVLAGIVFLLEMMYMGNKRRILDRIVSFVFNYKIVILLYAIITVMVVLFENPTIMQLVAGITGKTVNFSRRTIVWASLLPQIAKSPIIGYGYMPSAAYEKIIGFRGGSNAHNLILALLMNGGVILLALYTVLFCNTVKRKTAMYSLCDICLLIYLYATLLLGVTSAVFVLSTYAFVLYWIFEYEKKLSLTK